MVLQKKINLFKYKRFKDVMCAWQNTGSIHPKADRLWSLWTFATWTKNILPVFAFFYSLACSNQLLTATNLNYPTGDDLCSNGFGQFDSKKNQL